MDQIPSKPAAPKRLKMVGKQSMDAMLDLAVSRALRAEIAGLEGDKLRALQLKVREQFQGLLRQNARTVQGVSKGRFLSEMDSARQQILKKRSQAQTELGELERRTALIRSLHSVRGSKQTSDEHFEAKLEQRFKLLLEAAGPAVRRAEFPMELARFGAALAREEWNRILDEHAQGADLEIDNYRRRIEKLSGALNETEQALEAMAKLKEGDPGLASIYRNVRGLADDGIQSMQKRAMLKALYENNQELQSYRTEVSARRGSA